MFTKREISKDTLVWKYADANKKQYSEAEVKHLVSWQQHASGYTMNRRWLVPEMQPNYLRSLH